MKYTKPAEPGPGWATICYHQLEWEEGGGRKEQQRGAADITGAADTGQVGRSNYSSTAKDTCRKIQRKRAVESGKREDEVKLSHIFYFLWGQKESLHSWIQQWTH